MILTKRKVCIKCEEPKYLSEFPKDATLESGYRNVCLICYRLQSKQRYYSSDDKKKKVQEWRSQNKDRVSLYNKNYQKSIKKQKET